MARTPSSGLWDPDLERREGDYDAGPAVFESFGADTLPSGVVDTAPGDLVDGLEPVDRNGLARLLARYDCVWQW